MKLVLPTKNLHFLPLIIIKTSIFIKIIPKPKKMNQILVCPVDQIPNAKSSIKIMVLQKQVASVFQIT